MTSTGRSIAFWVIVVFLAVSVGLMLVGQTLGVFSNVPGPEIWFFIGTYMVAGVLGLLYIVFRGEELIR